MMKYAMVLLPLTLWAQTQPPERPHFVRASGEAVISAKPDRAQINIGVASQAPTAQAASAQNAEESTKVIAAIKQALGSAGSVKTSGYSLAPRYEYPQNHAPRLIGYEASNAVEVNVDELPLLGKVIDAATQAGANNINGVSFTLRDDAAVREQALSEAAKKARANAEALARALNLQPGAVLEAEPSEVPVVRPRPVGFVAMKAQAAPATPVEAGDLDIRATVTVTLEVH